MNKMQTLKAESKSDLFGAVTAMIGYTPTQSLTLLPFAGTRAHGVMRIDLPNMPADAAGMVATALSLLCRVPDVTGFVAVVFTDDTAADHQRLAEALRAAAPLFDLTALEVLYQTPTGWGDFFKGGSAPLDTLPAQPLPERVKEGDQHTDATLPAVDDLLAHRIHDAEHTATVDDSACNLFEDALTWNPTTLDPADAARLAAHLAAPLLRDVAVVQWATDLEQGRTALAVQRRHALDGAIAAIIVGDAQRPDPDRLTAALAVCRTIAAHTETAERAAALTVCGWLCWAMGLSTQAAFYIGQAIETDGTPRLADPMAKALERGILPAWSFAR